MLSLSNWSPCFCHSLLQFTLCHVARLIFFSNRYFCHFPALGLAKVLCRFRRILAEHRRPLIFWIFTSLISCYSPIGILWSNHRGLLAVLQIHTSSWENTTREILRPEDRRLWYQITPKTTVYLLFPYFHG
jgi:hypothetical protein